MKRFIVVMVVVFLIALISSVRADSPYLICDSYLGSDLAGLPDEFSISYGTVTITSPAQVVNPATGDRRLYWDLGPLAPGTYNIQVRAVKNDPNFGRLESDPTLFTFTKPAKPSAPVHIIILKSN
jgi:hypothetical protein